VINSNQEKDTDDAAFAILWRTNLVLLYVVACMPLLQFATIQELA
jgi:hypothetical protein